MDSFFSTGECGMEGNSSSTRLCGEYSEPMTCIIRDYKPLLPMKIGTVIAIDACKSAGTLAIEVQELSQRR